MTTRSERTQFHRESVDSTRQLAGVADQDDRCKNGIPGCQGPNSDTGAMPYFDCLIEGGDRDA